MQYNNVLLIHHSTPEPQKRASAFPGTRQWSPFSAGEGLGVIRFNLICTANIVQRYNFVWAIRKIFIEII